MFNYPASNSLQKTLLKPGAKVVLRKRKPLRPRIIIQTDSDGEAVTLNEDHPSAHRESNGSDIENEGELCLILFTCKTICLQFQNIYILCMSYEFNWLWNT